MSLSWSRTQHSHLMKKSHDNLNCNPRVYILHYRFYFPFVAHFTYSILAQPFYHLSYKSIFMFYFHDITSSHIQQTNFISLNNLTMFSDQCCYHSYSTHFCTPAYHVCVLQAAVNILRITVLKLSSGIEIIIFLIIAEVCVWIPPFSFDFCSFS